MSTPDPPTGRSLNQNPHALRRRRVAAGLSKLALARLAEISTTHMTAVELGQKSASAEVLGRLAQALDCQPEALMSEELISR